MFGFKKRKEKKLAEERAAAEKAAAEKAAAEKAAAEEAAAKRAAAEQAVAEKVAAEKAAAEKAAAEKAAAEKAAAEQPAAKKPTPKKPTTEQTAAKAPAKKPVAKQPATKPEAPKAAPKAEEITEEAVSAKGKFEIKRTSDNRYMFNVRAGNTQVIASSQIYSSMAACRNGINSVGVNAPIAAVEDQTLSSVNVEKCPKFQIYFDKGGKYRFNLLAANGQNILACTQGYTQKSSCKNGINSVIGNAHAIIVLPKEED